jgi:hypothetical protein
LVISMRHISHVTLALATLILILINDPKSFKTKNY